MPGSRSSVTVPGEGRPTQTHRGGSGERHRGDQHQHTSRSPHQQGLTGQGTLDGLTALTVTLFLIKVTNKEVELFQQKLEEMVRRDQKEKRANQEELKALKMESEELAGQQAR